MLIVITGGSGSGKSAFAEAIAMQCQEGSKVYLATMTHIDAEMEAKIKKHRQMRAGKQFRTIEQGCDLGSIKLSGESCVLLECMSNLVANEMYSNEKQGGNNIVSYIMSGVQSLLEQSEDVIIVTNEVFSEPVADEETKRYQSVLGEVNQRLAAQAQIFIEVVYGIPLVLKGEEFYENLT